MLRPWSVHGVNIVIGGTILTDFYLANTVYFMLSDIIDQRLYWEKLGNSMQSECNEIHSVLGLD